MKKTNTKRAIGALVIAVMMITSLMLPVSATTTTAALPSYQSSIGFDSKAKNGTWGTDGVWSATLINTANENPYSQITNVNDGGSFQDLTYYAYVNATEIAPVVGIDPAKNYYQTVGGAKTFTAPQSGKITISYAEMTHPTETAQKGDVVKGAYNQGMKFRVTKQTASSAKAGNVFPTATGNFVVSEKEKNNGFVMVESGATTETYISKGDKIHFEVMRDVADEPWQGVYCDPIITYTEVHDEPESRNVFKSSEYFAANSGNGTWDGGVWSATLVNTNTNAYSAITTTNAEGDLKDTTYGAYVNATQISPVTGNNLTNENLAIGGAKTFTAPKSGKITISYAEITHPTEATLKGAVVKYAHNQDAKFRITKQPVGSTNINRFYPKEQNTTIWQYYLYSKVNDELRVMVPSGTTTDLIVDKGDKIHFEVMRHTTSNAWQGVLCDPIITYTETHDEPAKRDTFRSSEYYCTDGETAKWDSGVWQAMFYNWDDTSATTERAKYQLMKGTREDSGVIKWANNEKSEAGTYNWNGNAAQVGAEYMRVELIPDDNATTEEKIYSDVALGYPIGRDYPVKAFVAPKDGIVTIYAAKLERVDATKALNIRIMKLSASGGEPVKVWPKNTWPKNAFKKYLTADAVEFEPVTTALSQGDMLLFECAFVFGDESASPYGGAVNWDPKVTYTSGVGVNDGAVVFKNGEAVVSGVVDIAAAASLTATVPVVGNTAYSNAAVVVAIYDNDGMLVRVGMNQSAAIAANDTSDIEVSFSDSPIEITDGSIKVFLWNSINGLSPISGETAL